MDGLTIGKVAKQAKVRIETLRYYERQGLVARPLRNRSNYRLYPVDTVRWVQFIKRAQSLGFSLQEIAELLTLRAEPTARCADVRVCAVAKIHHIDDKMRALQAMKTALVKLVEACAGDSPITDCPILELLDTEECG
jgi:MerR family mercuric resistance operon transcriptional regulator